MGAVGAPPQAYGPVPSHSAAPSSDPIQTMKLERANPAPSSTKSSKFIQIDTRRYAVKYKRKYFNILSCSLEISNLRSLMGVILEKRKEIAGDVKGDLLGLGSNNSSASTTSSTSSAAAKGAKRSRRQVYVKNCLTNHITNLSQIYYLLHLYSTL